MYTLCRDQANLPNTCTPDESSIDNDIGTEDLTERIVEDIIDYADKIHINIVHNFNCHLIVLSFLG